MTLLCPVSCISQPHGWLRHRNIHNLWTISRTTTVWIIQIADAEDNYKILRLVACVKSNFRCIKISQGISQTVLRKCCMNALSMELCWMWLKNILPTIIHLHWISISWIGSKFKVTSGFRCKPSQDDYSVFETHWFSFTQSHLLPRCKDLTWYFPQINNFPFGQMEDLQIEFSVVNPEDNATYVGATRTIRSMKSHLRG